MPMLGIASTRKYYEKIPPHAKKVFSGVLYDMYQWEQQMFDGTTETYECLARPPIALTIPVTKQGTIILNEEEQPWIGSFLSLPAGGCDSYEEEPLACAQRELREETGYKAGEWKLWTVYERYPKVLTPIFIFVARGAAYEGGETFDPGERITTKELSFEEFVALSDNDRFRNHEIRFLIMKARCKEGGLEELRREIHGL